MATKPIYRKNITIKDRQMEMSHDSYTGHSPLSDDFEDKLRESQNRLEELKSEKEKIERQAQELEELNSKKRIFLSSQVEITEKLTNAVTLIDRELLVFRKELHELEQCREAFAGRLNKISKYDPESWTRDNLLPNLERAIVLIDNASDEYESAAQHFSSMRSGEIFGTGKRTRRGLPIHAETGEFLDQVKNGLAFNLPIITLAFIGFIIYLLK